MYKNINFNRFCTENCKDSNNQNCINNCVLILQKFFKEISKETLINKSDKSDKLNNNIKLIYELDIVKNNYIKN